MMILRKKCTLSLALCFAQALSAQSLQNSSIERAALGVVGCFERLRGKLHFLKYDEEGRCTPDATNVWKDSIWVNPSKNETIRTEVLKEEKVSYPGSKGVEYEAVVHFQWNGKACQISLIGTSTDEDHTLSILAEKC